MLMSYTHLTPTLHPPYTHRTPTLCPRAQVGFFNAGMVRAKHVTAMMMQMLVAMSVRRLRRLRLATCMQQGRAAGPCSRAVQQGRAAGPCTHGRVTHAAVKEPLSYSHSRREGLAIEATWRQDL